jgi:catechol 2,3-dioxygenase-like lactoylglutathione lyase family enzyme/uncharacterized glyoxalase superfamily protein PhnB
MKIRALLFTGILGATCALAQDALPAPGFHHLHLNSPDPDAAIAFYTKAFTSASKSTFDGKAAVKTGKIWLLFNKVSSPAALTPQTAVWHWGWNVPDERAYIAHYNETKTKILPLWTGEGDNSVQINSDFYPGAGGTLGRTKAQIEEAKAQGLKPAGGAGFAYLAGPDGAMIEVAGNYPNVPERFNHVHMFQDDPLCAVLWYQQHLNVKPRPARGGGAPPTEATCKQPHGEMTFPALEKNGMYRAPQGGVSFDDIAMNWYIRPGDAPLASTRGHLADHIALSVGDLDAWYKKLKGEGVKILMEPYKLDNTRAFMVEGPSKEALELVEVK